MHNLKPDMYESIVWKIFPRAIHFYWLFINVLPWSRNTSLQHVLSVCWKFTKVLFWAHKARSFDVQIAFCLFYELQCWDDCLGHDVGYVWWPSVQWCGYDLGGWTLEWAIWSHRCCLGNLDWSQSKEKGSCEAIAHTAQFTKVGWHYLSDSAYIPHPTKVNNIAFNCLITPLPFNNPPSYRFFFRFQKIFNNTPHRSWTFWPKFIIFQAICLPWSYWFHISYHI